MGPPAPTTKLIAALIRKARTAEEQGQVLEPKNANAIDYYKQVLADDPANDEAAGGLDRIAGALRDWATAAIDRGDEGSAQRYVAAGVTAGLKQAFPERRPDGSDNKGFPSGHTSVSFAAAATLQNRYGWKVGLPAQALAAFVGLSRVEARKHHVHDVLVGAAIGEASGFLITRRASDRVQVFPWADAGGGGVAMTMRF